MKKRIKVLMLNQVYSDPIKDALIGFIEYTDKMRIKDLIKKCGIDKQFKEFEYYDKYIDPVFEVLLRAKYGQEKGQIDWNINLNDLYVYKLKEYIENDFIVLRSHGGVGGVDGIEILKIILEKIVDFIFAKLFGFIITYKKAVDIIEKETNKNIQYIKEVITEESKWNYGFISNKSFKHKKQVEKKIMKKLNYKLENNSWVLYGF